MKDKRLSVIRIINKISKTFMNKYEYKVIALHPKFDGWKTATLKLDQETIEQTLNGLGNDGWELVSTTSYTIDMTLGTGTAKIIFVFKREKK